MKKTNRLAFLWLLFAGLTIVPTSSLLHARNPEIGDEILKEPGSVQIKFTSTVPEESIKENLNKLIGDRVRIDEGQLIQFLEAKLRGITNLPLGVGEAAQKMLQPALDFIRGRIESYNQRRKEAIDQAAAQLKAILDGLSPVAKLSSEYQYCEGMRDPGDPGWGAVEGNIPGITGGSGKGTIALMVNVSLELAPLGVGGSISFDVALNLTAEAKGDLVLKEITGPTPVNRPVATVGCTPGLEVEISGTAGASTGLSVEVGGSIKFNTSFARITGVIEAGKHK
jgi:hypothetical protein